MQVGWMIAYIIDHQHLRNWEDEKDCIRENKFISTLVRKSKYDENLLSKLDKLACDNLTLQNVLCARNS